MTDPITKNELDEIIHIAELASGSHRVVSDAVLCRVGAMIRVHKAFISTALTLIQESGYTVKQASEGALVITGVVDEVALLDAQITELTARRERLLASHPLDINLLEEAF